MDTRVFCVYNLAGGVFVNSKVTLADTASEPLRMLSVLVGSMAQDAEAGLWLTPLYGIPSVPRLFPFDLVYLDKDHLVLESVEVLHGVRFPNYSQEVASALVLPLRSMASTRTQPGDRLIVCPKEDIERHLAAAEQASLAASGQSRNGSDGRMPALDECLGSAPTAGAPAGGSAVQAEPKPETSFTAWETTVPTAAGNGHKSETGTNAAEPTPRPGNGAANRASYRPRWEELIEASLERSLGAKEVIRTPESVEQASKVGTNSESVKPAAETMEQTSDAAPVLAIPMVESENVEPGKVEAGQPAVADMQKPFRYDDPGDVFANWVASPFAPPAWLEPELDLSRRLRPDPAAASEPVAPEKQIVSTRPVVSDSDGTLPPSPDSLPEAGDLRPDPVPAPKAAPAGQQATAFTVAQYGTWQVIAATPPGSVPGAEVTQTKPSKSMPSNGFEADERSRARESKLEGAEAGRVPSPAASPSFAASVTAKSVRDKRQQESASLVEPEPTSKTAQIVNSDRAIAGTGAQKAVPEVRGLSTAAREPLAEKQIVPTLAELRSENQKRAKDTVQEAAKPEPAISAPEKNGIPAKQPEAGGTVSKDADELTMTVPLPRFLKPEPKGKLKISIQKVPANSKNDPEAGSLRSRFQRWLKPVAPPSDRRRAHRRYVPGVAAYYYTGGAPKPHEVADISMSGFYLVTDERWMPGTMIQMTLQKPCARGERKQSIAVLAKIVRKGTDGVGAEFVMPETLDQHGHAVPPERTTDRFSLARFL